MATTALLHDVGKQISRSDIARNLGIDLKSRDEELLYKLHPLFAYNYLSNFPEIKATVKNGILFHHINEDLSGFPPIKR